MKRINNKGFTLVEVLAVVIILGILIAIMIPNVNKAIQKNNERNYKQLIESFENAAKVYVSDNRYNIELNTTTKNCNTVGVSELELLKISNTNLINSKVPIKVLIETDALKPSKDGQIYNPKTKEKLDLDQSYVTVMYQCQTKDYTYKVSDTEVDLVWE